MPTFTYKARNPAGNVASGSMDAKDIRTATDRLKNQKLIVLEINESKPGSLLDTLKNFNPFKPSVKSKDLVVFSRQLSTLINSGVPLVQGLAILAAQIENPAFRLIVEKIKEEIESGISIHDAMKKYPQAFGELYLTMVRAGELGGVLDVTLDRLASYQEASEELKQKVKGAMMYPAVVMTIALGVVIFLLVFIIPKFQEMFESFGGKLPIPTQILVTVSHLTAKFFWVLPLGAFGCWRGLSYLRTKPDSARKIDFWILKIPIFGPLLKKVAVAKFTRTLATLLKSGVNILEALDAVSRITGNKVMEETLLDTKKSVQEGQRLVEPLKKGKIFPPMVTQMIAIGEESGNLDKMLNKIADFYDSEIDSTVKGLTSLIEPLVIVFLGVVIGAIVIAMFLPMFEISTLASNAG